MLSKKQEKFCEEYLKDCNGKQAAIRAGYSEKCAKEQAYDLLTRPHIIRHLTKLKDKATARNELTVDSVLQEFRALREAALQKDEPDLSIAMRATENEAKFLGLFQDRLKVSGDKDNPIETIFHVEFVKKEKK